MGFSAYINQETKSKRYRLNEFNSGYDQETSDLIRQLSEEDLLEALGRALAYAQKETKFLQLVDCRIDPQELVQEAIARTFGTGTGRFGNNTYRNWNRDKYPTLYELLRSIIKSMRNHVLEEHKGITFISTETDDHHARQKLEVKISEKSASFTPEDILTKSEDEIYLNSCLKKISEDDDEIAIFLTAIKEGITKASEQSDITGFDINTVYNIKRRLKRKLKPFFSSMNSKSKQ